MRLTNDFGPINETVSFWRIAKAAHSYVLAAAGLETITASLGIALHSSEVRVLVPTSCAVPLVDCCDSLARMLVVLL